MNLALTIWMTETIAIKLAVAGVGSFLIAALFAPMSNRQLMSMSSTGSEASQSVSGNAGNDFDIGCPSNDPTVPTIKRQDAIGTVQAAWSRSRFSDPNHHDSKHFRYIVHMLNRSHNLNKRSLEEIYTFIVQNVAQNSCAYLSASVIDQNKRGTFGNIGFILQVPSENILIAESHDIASGFFADNHNPARFNWSINLLNSQIGGLRSPDEILRQTPLSEQDPFSSRPLHPPYNEVLVEGFYREPIRIVGVLVNTPSDFQGGSVTDIREKEVLDLKTLSLRYGIPLINISK